jgi:Spx/MgsR family transcriptional regulator
MKAIKVYEYSNCSTCKKALKFLDNKKIPYEKVPIVENPPTRSELLKMIGFLDGNFRKLFNTSGLVYREMKLGEKIKTLSQEEALTLLEKNGKLVKRPFVLTSSQGVVGFKEAEWEEIFA